MKVSPQMIRELRERTQAGMTDCKNALIEAEGDIEKAVEIILKKGQAKAAKRSSAVATEGEIRAWVAEDKRSGALFEVNIQTDFAARNENFRKFLDELETIAANCNSLEDMLKAKMENGKTVEEVRDELIATIGEKIDVRRFERVTLDVPVGSVHSYVHMNGKIGVLLLTEAENEQVLQHPAYQKFIDETAMQVAAMNPAYLDPSAVPEDAVEKQREIFLEQVKTSGKPEQAWPKIIEGKINKWYTEVCLMRQNSVIENRKSVEQVCADASKEAGGKISVLGFVRFGLGEGLQKKEDDFAEEAKKMANI